MRESEARQELLKRIVVSRQLVTLAKAFLMSLETKSEDGSRELARRFANQQGFDYVQLVVLHPSVDPEPQLSQAAGYLRCEIAFAQALWELIHAGYYMYFSSIPQPTEPRQGWTTVFGGGGGQTSGWTFPEFKYVVPDHILRSPYYRYQIPEPVTDPDLFVLEAGIEGADTEVVEALQDALRCLRHELHRPAVTMLGKAMEGAWIELGLALGGAVPEHARSQGEKVIEHMKDEDRSIARKISDVMKLYERRDLLEQVMKASEVRPEELRSAVVWSDVVREARNAIHFGENPTIANSYEKVVVLFLDAAKCLEMMYRIKGVAEQAS